MKKLLLGAVLALTALAAPDPACAGTCSVGTTYEAENGRVEYITCRSADSICYLMYAESYTTGRQYVVVKGCTRFE